MEVVPSFYSVEVRGQESSPIHNFIGLRSGEVQRIIYPTDKDSRSKLFIEYEVAIDSYQNEVFNTVMYRCVLINSLAGLADKCSFTLRADPTVNKALAAKKAPRRGLGSKVLVLCLNGSQDQGVIIGGIRDSDDRSEIHSKHNGHNFHFNFNGIDIKIDKDGQLILEYQGATEANGKRRKDVSPASTGTKLTIKKSGDLVINSGTQSITIDRKTGQTKIKGNGLLLGKASEPFIKGATYRSAQAQLHAQIMSSLAPGISAIALKSAGGLPELATALTAVVSAIASFEARAATYLSLKNKGD